MEGMKTVKTIEENAADAKAVTETFMKLERLTKIGGLEKSESGETKKASTMNQGDLITLGLDSKEETEKCIDKFLRSELETLYDELDINGNDFLQADEILCTFHQFGFQDVTLEECLAVCEEFTGQKGLDIITLHDFKGGMWDYMKHGTTDHNLKMVFDLMDYKRIGLVGPAGLGRLFAMFGLHLHPNELFSYIDAIDIKKTGVFDFAQFKIYCTSFDMFGKLKNQFDALITKEYEDDEESVQSTNSIF